MPSRLFEAKKCVKNLQELSVRTSVRASFRLRSVTLPFRSPAATRLPLSLRKVIKCAIKSQRIQVLWSINNYRLGTLSVIKLEAKNYCGLKTRV